jgi:phenylpropionate dioxygenase-like ring-hydroxylating dioxygenase large terminal subunit
MDGSQLECVGFHRSWFPVALAREIAPGSVTGVDFLGTRVIVYRDEAGKPVVQSAWCPHLGADLTLGALVDGGIRCAYHHWRFDASGACAHIPTGDKIPPGARIATYPAAEAWGLIWAFNGPEPLFGLPRIPDTEEPALEIEAHLRGLRQVPPWVAISNGVDFQHLRSVHNLQAETPETIEVRAHAIEYRIETSHYLQHGLITGTNVFAQHLRTPAIDSFMLFTGAPIDRQRTRSFFVIGVAKGGESAAERQMVAAKLAGLRAMVEKLIGEDEPILNTMRFKQGVMVASDRHLSRYFKYVAEFPRAE